MEVAGATQPWGIIWPELGIAIASVYAVRTAMIPPRDTIILMVVAWLALSISIALPIAGRMSKANWSTGWIVLWLVLAPMLTFMVFSVLGNLLFLIASRVERRSRSRK